MNDYSNTYTNAIFDVRHIENKTYTPSVALSCCTAPWIWMWCMSPNVHTVHVVLSIPLGAEQDRRISLQIFEWQTTCKINTERKVSACRGLAVDVLVVTVKLFFLYMRSRQTPFMFQ